MVCTSSRGGHWGTGFLCSLLKIADDKGMAFWTPEKYEHEDLKWVLLSFCLLFQMIFVFCSFFETTEEQKPGEVRKQRPYFGDENSPYKLTILKTIFSQNIKLL